MDKRLLLLISCLSLAERTFAAGGADAVYVLKCPAPQAIARMRCHPHSNICFIAALVRAEKISGKGVEEFDVILRGRQYTNIDSNADVIPIPAHYPSQHGQGCAYRNVGFDLTLPTAALTEFDIRQYDYHFTTCNFNQPGTVACATFW